MADRLGTTLPVARSTQERQPAAQQATRRHRTTLHLLEHQGRRGRPRRARTTEPWGVVRNRQQPCGGPAGRPRRTGPAENRAGIGPRSTDPRTPGCPPARCTRPDRRHPKRQAVRIARAHQGTLRFPIASCANGRRRLRRALETRVAESPAGVARRRQKDLPGIEGRHALGSVRTGGTLQPPTTRRTGRATALLGGPTAGRRRTGLHRPWGRRPPAAQSPRLRPRLSRSVGRHRGVPGPQGRTRTAGQIAAGQEDGSRPRQAHPQAHRRLGTETAPARRRRPHRRQLEDRADQAVSPADEDPGR